MIEGTVEQIVKVTAPKISIFLQNNTCDCMSACSDNNCADRMAGCNSSYYIYILYGICI